MKARLRRLGVGGSLAALLATGALLLPAAPAAQARPSANYCASLESVIELALDFGHIGYALELTLRYIELEC
jgi:hypothetical protein